MSKKTQIDKKRLYQDLRTELYRSEQRFRDIAEVASDWFWETDSDHRFTYISDKFYEVSSISPKEVIGKTRLEFISDHERKTNPNKWKDHEATISTRRPFRNLDYQVPTPDGKPCYIRISGKAFFSEDDIFLGYRGAGSDITAQKVAERELVESAQRASENEYRLTLNDLRIGVVVHAGDTSILLSNPEAANILGLTYEQMSGKKAIDPAWNFVHEDLSIMKDGDYPVSKVLSTKKPLHDYVLGIRRPDRDYVTWVIVNASPVFSVENELEKVVVNFVDITARMQAEEALRQSKERIESIVNNAVMGIYQVTHEGRFLLVNPKFAQMFGFNSPEQFLASVDNISQLYAHPEERSSILNKIRDRNFIDGFEIQFLHQDGQIITNRVSVRVIEDKTKGMIYEGFMADITDQKRMEDALRESEQKYKSLANNLNVGIFRNSVGSKGKFLEANPAIIKMFGFESREDFLRVRVSDLYKNPDDRNAYNAKLLKNNEVKNEELQLQKKDGITFVGSVSAVVVKNENDSYFDGIIEDISERKQAEEALRESEEKYRHLFETAMVGIYRTRIEDGKFLAANQKMATMLGYESVEKLVKEYVTSAHYTDPTLRKKLLNELLSYGRVDGFEIEMTRTDGSTIQIALSAIAYPEQGYLEGFIVDITQIKETEAALRESEEKLARSKKMESLGLLAGGVAHDLNNVLSGIVSYPELILLDLPEDSKFRAPIETIKESGLRAVAIVQDLLTVARGVAITREPLILNNLVSDYLHSPEFNKLKKFHPMATVKTKLTNDLLNISASPVHIRKVLMNLVSNAAEAVEGSGSITISTMNRYLDRPLRGYDFVNIGEYVVLSVADDGSGISSEDLERIFEPFYSKKFMGRSGTGLGLAVVWNILLDHKGYIDVITDKHGTAFELYLPITRDDVFSKSLPLRIDDFKGDGETILVVDDIETQREISCKMLDTLGYKTKTVSSGEEAIEYLKKNTVDCLLLDMIMDPGINGRETYEKIIEIHPNQKAIIVSGFSKTDDVREIQKLGAGQYIKKPVTLEKIGIAIKEELGKQ